MSGQFYYLISSLPDLRLGEKPPFSVDEFLGMCTGDLNETQMETLKKVDLYPEFDPKSVSSELWISWERYLRNFLTETRALKQKEDADLYKKELIDVFPSDRRQFEELMNNSDPAERERGFDNLRWKRLEDCKVGHNFDFNALAVYKLMLMLVEKWSTVSDEYDVKNLNELMDFAVKAAEEKRTTIEQ